jgi:hypothetical protein
MAIKSTLLISLLLLVASLLNSVAWSDEKNLALPPEKYAFENTINLVYQSLNEPSLNCEAFRCAMLGFMSLNSGGKVSQPNILSIIDYSLPSSAERLFVIDLKNRQLRYRSLVAHGKNSGEGFSTQFSNKAQSHKSSLGFFITGEAYLGAHGYSMLLNGIDTGYNDHAKVRGIVFHGANYVTNEYVNRYGRLGRSLGCPALPPARNAEIINLIKEGSLLFSYFPDAEYFNKSTVLHDIPDFDYNIAENF